MWYKYWSNKTEWHGELLFECQADKLTEADKLFEVETGIDPVKAPWVGCQVLGFKCLGNVEI